MFCRRRAGGGVGQGIAVSIAEVAGDIQALAAAARPGGAEIAAGRRSVGCID